MGKSHVASPMAYLTQSLHPLAGYLGVTSGYKPAMSAYANSLFCAPQPQPNESVVSVSEQTGGV